MKAIKWIFGLAPIAVATVVLIAGISPSLTASVGDKIASTAAVKIDNFSFGPATVAIAVGTTITWTNQDDVPHVVASDDKLFKSKPLDTDDHFSFTFTKSGTYSYYCTIHPKMMAKVLVR